ncbi:immunoglobulin domain-containing protein [Photobacterium damselae subsp. damselae]|uniref:immunoglobulin domain-containing protein n=1 Tax=Photobacterium damselae TaxID=38293 RepID=UPI001F215D95|nr:immunoglobulin domain-containing protein [Photobacterium damselae]UKA23397.1 immunoglobulin domain-containing protein [Photobacterium damselae subsp. damselae]
MTNKMLLTDVIALMRGQPNFRALPSQGRISASDINTELGRPATSRLSLNDAGARELAGKPQGRIAYSDFHGKVLLTAPRFTEQPKAASVTEGQRATFTARAVDSGTGSGHITYQWYVNNSPVHGATGTSFSINANINDNNKSIKCKASNRKGSVFSETVLLTVAISYNIQLTVGQSGAGIKTGYAINEFGSAKTNGQNGLMLNHPSYGSLRCSQLYGQISYNNGQYPAQVYMLIMKSIPATRWRIRADGLDVTITANSYSAQGHYNNGHELTEWIRGKVGQTVNMKIEPV